MLIIYLFIFYFCLDLDPGEKFQIRILIHNTETLHLLYL